MNQFLPYLLSPNLPRPNPLVGWEKKDKKYHADMTRWCVSTVNITTINKFRAQGWVNSNFYANNQWIIKEDVDTFLMDGTQDARNRLAANFNILKTIVEKYRGTAIQMSFNALARAISARSITRKDNILANLLTMQDIAMTSKAMNQAVKSQYPIGDSEEETIVMHENGYRDPLVSAINHLIKSVAALPDNQFNMQNAHDAFDMATYGAVATIARQRGSHMVFDRIDLGTFYWDTRANLYDLTDSGFMGCCPQMELSEIGELWQPGRAEMEILESTSNYAYPFQSRGWDGAMSSPKVTVFSNVWKDIAYCEMGYVKGIDGLPELVKVNYLDPNAPPGTKPRYTDNDLIDPPNTPDVYKAFKGKKKRRTTIQIARYCDMVPWEYLFGCDPKNVPKQYQADLVLDYGVCPFQEVNPMDSTRVKLPIKAAVWALNEGQVVSPISDIIFPQRFLNRIVSVTEQQMNNAGSKGTFIDVDMLTVPGVDEAEAGRRAKRGEMIPVSTQGRGVPNAFGIYDTTPGAGTHNYFQVMQQVVGMIRLVSATPEPVTGTPTQDQLVGVTDLLIQRSNLLDEPFYNALERFNLQKYQHIATAGVQFYNQHPETVKDLVSEKDLAPLIISDEAALERWQIAIQRVSADDVQRKQVDQTLMLLLQIQCIDRPRFADLYGRGTMDEVLKAMREYQVDLARAEKEAQRAQAKQAMAQAIDARNMQLNEQADKLHEDTIMSAENAAKNQNKLDQINARAEAKILTDRASAELEAASGGGDQERQRQL